jgi:hypothetical protein
MVKLVNIQKSLQPTARTLTHTQLITRIIPYKHYIKMTKHTTKL